MDDDIFDITDEMRRAIPGIIRDRDEFLEFIRFNHLLIDKRLLIQSAISHSESIIEMLQTMVIALYMHYQNTHSEETFRKIEKTIESTETLKKFVSSLENNGYKMDKTQLAHLIERQTKQETKILSDLITITELCALTEEGDKP